MPKRIRQYRLQQVNANTFQALVPSGYTLLSVAFPTDPTAMRRVNAWCIVDDAQPPAILKIKLFKDNDDFRLEHPGSYVRTLLEGKTTYYHVFHMPPEHSALRKGGGNKSGS